MNTSILPRLGQITDMGVGFCVDQWKMMISIKKYIHRFLCDHNKEPLMITHNKSEAVIRSASKSREETAIATTGKLISMLLLVVGSGT